MERTPSPIPVFIPLLVGGVAVSFSSILIKWSAAPSSVLGMYRLLLTVVFMLPFLPKYRKYIAALSTREWGSLLLAGLFLGLHFLFWIGSLKYTTVGSSVILMALEPVFVMLGAFLVFRERTGQAALIGMGVALLGTVVVSGGDMGQPGASLFGDVLSVLGAVFISINMLIGQSLRTNMSSFVYNFMIFLIAGLVMVLYNLALGVPMIHYSHREWGIFLLLAIVPTVFGHALFNWVLKYVRATTVSMTILGEPVGAIILAFFLLGEPITVYHIIGGALTLAGVFVFLRTHRV